MRWLILILSYLLLPECLDSQYDVLAINEELVKNQNLEFTPYLYLFQDTLGIYSIEDVADDSFQNRYSKDFDKKLIDSGLGSGFSPKYYWIRLAIKSEVGYPTDWMQYWDRGSYKIYFYEDSTYKMQLLGYLHHDNVGTNSKSTFTNNFKMMPGETKYFYYQIPGQQLYVGTGLGTILDKHIFSKEYLHKIETKYWMVNGLILGIFLAVAGYHLLIFFLRKYLEYLYLAMFIISYAFVFSSFSRILSEWFLSGPQNEYLIILISFGWSATYIFHYLFTRKFLNLPILTPQINRYWLITLLLRIIQTIIVTMVVLYAGGMSRVTLSFYNPFLILVGVVGAILIIFPIVAAIFTMKKRLPQASLYLIAMMAFILQMILGELNFQKIIMLPEWFPGQGGAIITVFLFAAGIAHKLKLLEDEKNTAEEARLRQEVNLQKAKELDTFKSKFFTNISHEFRTPLTIILGMADQIKQHPSTWLDNGLEMIRSNGSKLLSLINQILEISKLEGNSFPVNKTTGDIIENLKYLVEAHQSMAQSKNLTLQFNSGEDFLVMEYDPEIISQILGNLITNAIKYTPDNGHIEVTCSYSDDAILDIRVQDTGIGISKKEIPKIFNRYYQVPQDHPSGFGIGLALTQELVLLLNGNIEVQSEPGQGSVFIVRIPISRKENMEKIMSPGDHSRKSTVKIILDRNDHPLLLIVEDSPDVISYLRALLEEYYSIDVAMDGKAGWDKAIAIIPDLIISDYMMPKMDGITMCNLLKNDIRTNHIPIIMLTAKADNRSKITGISEGVDAYLTKPFNKEELMIMIKQLIKSREKLKERYSDVKHLFLRKDLLPENLDNQFIKDVTSLVIDHLGQPEYNIHSLSSDMAMSRSQLYRKFSALSSIPIAEFIKKLRLQKAYELLQHSSLNITEVSLETGFKNLSTFSRNFTEEFGINPKKIKKIKAI